MFLKWSLLDFVKITKLSDYAVAFNGVTLAIIKVLYQSFVEFSKLDISIEPVTSFND